MPLFTSLLYISSPCHYPLLFFSKSGLCITVDEEIGKQGRERSPTLIPQSQLTLHSPGFFSANWPPLNSQLHVYTVLLPPSWCEEITQVHLISVVLTVFWIGAWFVQILLKERITNKVGLLYKFSGCPHFLTMPLKTLKATGCKKKIQSFLDFQSGCAWDGAWMSFWHFTQPPLEKTALNQSLSVMTVCQLRSLHAYDGCRYDCLPDCWHLFLHTSRSLLTFEKCCIWNLLFITAPLSCMQQSQPTPVLWSWAVPFQTRDDITHPPLHPPPLPLSIFSNKARSKPRPVITGLICVLPGAE